MASSPIKNVMEMYVNDIIDGYLNNVTDVCKCTLCRNDMIAYALNQLPPKYVVTTEGEVWTKVNMLTPQYQADVTAALGKAIQIVKQNRRH